MTDASELDDLERVPCDDGNCIGTLGLDGRCRVCGLAGSGPAPTRAADADAIDSAFDDDPMDEGDDDDAHADDPDDPWADRRLCPDGSCIGTIGDDGRCRECGREAE